MDPEKQEEEILRFVKGVQAIPRSFKWQIIAPMLFEQKLESISGQAVGIINVIGTYMNYEDAIKDAENLIEKYPGRLLSVVPANEWYPLCEKYDNVDLLPMDPKQKISEFTKSYIRKQREDLEREKIKDELLDKEFKARENKQTIEYYAHQLYQARLRREQLEAHQAEITAFAMNYEGDLDNDLKEHLHERLTITDEIELEPKMYQEHLKSKMVVITKDLDN